MNLDQAIHELRELKERVPKAMRLPTTYEVARVEQKLGVTFHADYRKYLLEASDVVYGTKEPCTVRPDGGHTDLVNVAQTAWDQMGVPRHLLPICEDNGDYYCINEAGQILFWCHNGATDEKWPVWRPGSNKYGLRRDDLLTRASSESAIKRASR